VEVLKSSSGRSMAVVERRFALFICLLLCMSRPWSHDRTIILFVSILSNNFMAFVGADKGHIDTIVPNRPTVAQPVACSFIR